jgi:Flp pilus assembly secretin CpaC
MMESQAYKASARPHAHPPHDVTGVSEMSALTARFAGIVAVVALLSAPAVVSAAPVGETVEVTIDFAKILRLDEPAATILIGNPGIADASVEDEKTVVLTGKTAGTTNLIILDKEGKEMANAVVRVSSDIQQLTTIFYGRNRQTFSCSPTCERVISVGDSPESFDAATTQIQGRQTFSMGQ